MKYITTSPIYISMCRKKGTNMRYIGRPLILSAAVAALCMSCASTPETVVTVKKATDVALIENIEERIVHTFNDPREQDRLEGHSWVWPEDAQSLVNRNESRISFSRSTDSPDGSTYLIWNVDVDYDRERFPAENSDIGQRLHFNYTPLFAVIPEYEADGIFVEAKASETFPAWVQFHGRDLSGNISVTFPTAWEKIYLPFAAFRVHYHDEDRQEAGIRTDNLMRFWDFGIEMNFHEWRKILYAGSTASQVEAAIHINSIGLYHVTGKLPDNIVEYFDNPLPHLAFDFAAPEIFSPDEKERNRTDIIVDAETLVKKVLDGDGAEDTNGYFTMRTKFEVSDKVKELGDDSGIGFIGRFYGVIDMSSYSALGFSIRTRGVDRVGFDLENYKLRTGVHGEIKIEKENEWIRVEIPFHSFHYDERIPLNEQNLKAFFKDVNEIRINLPLESTTGFSGEKGDRGAYIGRHDFRFDIDNIELIGEMPAFSEFMAQMKETRR